MINASRRTVYESEFSLSIEDTVYFDLLHQCFFHVCPIMEDGGWYPHIVIKEENCHRCLKVFSAQTMMMIRLNNSPHNKKHDD